MWINVSKEFDYAARYSEKRAVNALNILSENRIRPYQRGQMISVIMDDNVEEIEPLIHVARKVFS